MFEGWLGVTIMPGGPKWCELFLILYRTPYSTKLKGNKTDVVTVCLFRIFTFEQILLNTVTVAKHFVVLTDLEYSCVVIFAKLTTHRNQQLQRALYSNSELTLYAKLRPLVVGKCV